MPHLLVWSLATLLLAAPPLNLNMFHGQTLIIDLHVDTLHKMRTMHRPNFNHGPLDLNKQLILKSGLNIQFFSIWVPNKVVRRGGAQRYAWSLIKILERLISNNQGWMVKVTTVAELEQAFRGGRFGALLGMEGAEPLAGNPLALRQFVPYGLRYVALTWNRSNVFGDPAVGPKTNGGITSRGRMLVSEANRLRVFVDVSHASVATFWGILMASRAPVIASHSNARSICDHPRNLDDEQLKAIARSGGVVGMNFYTRYLNGSKNASSLDVVRHIRYIADLVGIKHLALGSDFDGSIIKPGDLRNVSHLPHLTSTLLAGGFSPSQIRLIYGLNFVAAFRRLESGFKVPVARRPLPILRPTSTGLKSGCLRKVFDHNRLTGCDGPPAGLSLSFELKRLPSALGVIVARLGRQRYRLDKIHPRARSLDLSIRDRAGKLVYRTGWKLKDSKRMQYIGIPRQRSNSPGYRVTLALTGSYPGQSKTAPVVFSEVVAYDR